MNITYKKGDDQITVWQSNEDVTLEIQKEKNRRKVILKANRDITLISADYQVGFSFDDKDLIFLNGYQSWTDTKEYSFKEKQNNLKKVPKPLVDQYSFKAAGAQAFYDFPLGIIHGFDLGYIKGKKELLIASENYQNAYLIIEVRKEKNRIVLRSDVDGKVLCKDQTFPVFDFYLTNQISSGLESYWKGKSCPSRRKLFGYTSWYNHYQNINEDIIRTALAEADPRFELFQIDDGFEPFVGDWLSVDQTKFPNGLSPIVDEVHAHGMLAGIWLAPFVAEKKSALYQEHPDWIAKDLEGNEIMAGPNWSGFCPLDLNKPQALEYVRSVLRYYKDLGFDFFKLDFLYASNLKPLEGRTRAESSDYIYGVLREELQDRLILGCGAVVTNAFSRFDYMRVGPDVSLIFDDVFYMKHFHRERISTKVTLQNTIYRSLLNGKVFLNDPDVFLLRDENISLSREQRLALTTINAAFGSLLMTSDNPKNYSQAQKEILDRALHIFRDAGKASYEREGDLIHFHFQMDEADHSFTYHTKKGVLING